MSVCVSICLKLIISVPTELIWFYSSGIIPTSPMMVLSYFLGGESSPTPTPPKKKKKNDYQIPWGKAPRGYGRNP